MRLTSLCKIRCEVAKTKPNEIIRAKPDLKREGNLKVRTC